MKIFALELLILGLSMAWNPNVLAENPKAEENRIHDVINDMESACVQDPVCYSTRSYNLPDDIGRILRTACLVVEPNHRDRVMNVIGCWHNAIKYLRTWSFPSSAYELARYKIGLGIDACDGIPGKLNWDGNELDAKKGVFGNNLDKVSVNKGSIRVVSSCFYNATSVLTEVENSWILKPQVDIIFDSCRLPGVNLADRLYGSCFQVGLANIHDSPLAKNHDEEQRIILKGLGRACDEYRTGRDLPGDKSGDMETNEYAEYNGDQVYSRPNICYDTGFQELNLPDMTSVIVHSACHAHSDVNGCFGRATQYLATYPRPLTDHDKLSYTAGLILSMCSSYNDACAIAALTSVVVDHDKDGNVIARQQNVQASMNPLLQVGVDCKSGSCYNKVKVFFEKF